MHKLIWLELLSSWRQKNEWLNATLFLLSFCVIFSLASDGFSQQSKMLASLVISFGFLFVNQFVIDTHWRYEKWQGCLYHYLLSKIPIWHIILAKSISLWCITTIPVLFIIPVLSLIMCLKFMFMLKIMFFILVASPAIVSFAMLASIMTITMARPSVLFSLIVMPLVIPIILLGQSAMRSDELFCVEYVLIAAVSVLCVTFLPHINGFLLKETIE
jgi:heme exporter protein B